MKRKIRWKSISNRFKVKNRGNIIVENDKPGDEIQINPIEIIKLLYQNRYLILTATLVIMLITAAVTLTLPNKYTSHASILPTGKSDSFSSLKELAGIGNLSGSVDENSSALFPRILQSRQVKKAVVNQQYEISNDDKPDKQTLKEYYGTTVPEQLYGRLNKITAIAIDKKTGVIDLSVETKIPQLSQAILNQYLTELENFNIYKRRSSARQNMVYLERELKRQKDELEQSENKLEAFQLVNRNWDVGSDPEILKELSQRRRDILAKTEAYLFINSQLELAKLETQKDIPIVRILDQPTLPQIKSSPRRGLLTLMTGGAAFFLICLGLIVADSIRNYNRRNRDQLTTTIKRNIPELTTGVPR